MPVRPLDLLDLPIVHRYRGETLILDSARALTRGNPLGAVALFAYLNPTQHIHTAVCTENGQAPLLGGVTHHEGETFARLSFLAPKDGLDSGRIPELLDVLSVQAGRWGTFHLLAEVEENTAIYRSMRQAGFSVYVWQRIWNLTSLTSKPSGATWQRASRRELLSIQVLYHQIIPALLQPVEAFPKQTNGMICRVNGELQAYAGLISGPRGLLVQPLIHPDTDEVSEKLTGLLRSLPKRRGRMVYFCVRSYQAWLEPVLEDLGAKAGPRQAVMVKHLAILQREMQALPTQAEKAWAKPAAPIVSVVSRDEQKISKTR